VTYTWIKCYNCQGQGHCYASVCPVEEEVTMLQVEPPSHEEAIEGAYLSSFTILHLKEHCFHQRSRNIIPYTWILLDSQSTVSVFKNRQLLSNIRNSTSPLCVHTNSGMMKGKRCGKIKGRTVANGRPQKVLYTKDETSSPTVSTDALMMSVMIDACEHRDMATAEVAGAYLHTSLEDFVFLVGRRVNRDHVPRLRKV
jgi:hypothetical protein